MLDTSIIVSVKRIITTTVVETITIVGKVEVMTGTKSVAVKLDIVMVTVSVVGLLDTVHDNLGHSGCPNGDDVTEIS